MCGPCPVATSTVNANDNHNRILMHMHDVSVAHLPCVHICMHTHLRAAVSPTMQIHRMPIETLLHFACHQPCVSSLSTSFHTCRKQWNAPRCSRAIAGCLGPSWPISSRSTRLCHSSLHQCNAERCRRSRKTQPRGLQLYCTAAWLHSCAPCVEHGIQRWQRGSGSMSRLLSQPFGAQRKTRHASLANVYSELML